MRKTIVTLTSVLLICVLLATAIMPIGAQAQGVRTFRKAPWNLTVQYPSDWTVEEDASDVINLGANEGGIVIVYDSIYADPNYDLESVFWDVLSKLGGDAEGFDLVPGEPRTIAGAKARSGTFTATISGADVEGSLYIFAKGKNGFGIATAWVTDSWDPQVDDTFESILDSIKIGAASPTPTRTRRAATPTPARPTPKPTATPTEEVVPTEELVATEEAAPTEEAIETPTAEAVPTEEVTEEPTAEPTEEATPVPTEEATIQLTEEVPAVATSAPSSVEKPKSTVRRTPTVTSTAAITVTTPMTSTTQMSVTTPMTSTTPMTRTTPVTRTAAVLVAPRS